MEAVRRVALVAARQSVERQPPSDRGVRDRRPIAGLGETPACTTTRRIATRSSGAARSTPRMARRVGDDERWLIALTSIHWREAWKYGERAFRYCQHDLGHAIAAVGIAAAIAGLARDAAARVVARRHRRADRHRPRRGLRRGRARGAGVPARSARRASPAVVSVESRARCSPPFGAGEWTGRASQLSEDHVTVDVHRRDRRGHAAIPAARRRNPVQSQLPDRPIDPITRSDALVLQRAAPWRSTAARRSSADAFFAMLSRVMPGDGAPWDALWWTRASISRCSCTASTASRRACTLLRARCRGGRRLRAACAASSCGSRRATRCRCICLRAATAARLARRLSCDQDIAADGFFSLGMLADFDASLEQFGPSFYRICSGNRASSAGAVSRGRGGRRARTGIGCFYDDPVHDVLGLAGHAFQSLYHFTSACRSRTRG